MNRNEVIKRIKTALQKRSGKTWSVTGGRGTAYGWITISAPPTRCIDGWKMPESDQKELAALLGKESVHHQGESIPGQNDFYQEYIDRAEGRTPARIGKPNWD